jgi:hypothetical protein
MPPIKRVAKPGTDTSEDLMDNTAPALKPPSLGEVISVKAAPERLVANKEYGGFYSETDTVPAAVTLRVLRLLQDGDLVRQ